MFSGIDHVTGRRSRDWGGDHVFSGIDHVFSGIDHVTGRRSRVQWDRSRDWEEIT